MKKILAAAALAVVALFAVPTAAHAVGYGSPANPNSGTPNTPITFVVTDLDGSTTDVSITGPAEIAVPETGITGGTTTFTVTFPSAGQYHITGTTNTGDTFDLGTFSVVAALADLGTDPGIIWAIGGIAFVVIALILAILIANRNRKAAAAV